ncbi:MAG: MFS transporter [Deltaproteobacteria bacterium]|nr:MFS transporter [Deltaproteobacteria bacterium]
MKKTSLGVVFLIVMMDLVGFGLILPLIPLYADHLGASVTYIGLLLSIYSIMQFVFNPLWGSLSDRLGRRPVILISLAGSSLSYVLYGSAEFVSNDPDVVLGVLFFSRMMAGLMGANISTAQAYVADITKPEDRARGMGVVGAAIGLGFVLGPAMGAVFSQDAMQDAFGMSAPGFVAAFICLVNLGWAMMRLGESLPEKNRRTVKPIQNRWRMALGQPVLMLTLGALFLLTLTFTQMETSFALLGKRQFQFSTAVIGMVFAYIGIVVVVMQGGMTKRIVRKMGEEKTLILGSLVMAGGMGMVAGLNDAAWVVAGLGLVGAGLGLSQPCLLSLLSLNAPADKQGLFLGLGQSLGSLARIFGPNLGLNLFGVISMRAPYWLGGGLMLGVALAGMILAGKKTRKE